MLSISPRSSMVMMAVTADSRIPRSLAACAAGEGTVMGSDMMDIIRDSAILWNMALEGRMSATHILVVDADPELRTPVVALP
jgi:hypothetical protein